MKKKKIKKVKKPSKTQVYTSIDRPLFMKKQILESALLSAKLIKHTTTIQNIRVEKYKAKTALQIFTTQLKQDVHDLSKLLPALKGPKTKAEYPEPSEEFEEQPKIEVSEIDELEQELDDVNKRLDSLDF